VPDARPLPDQPALVPHAPVLERGPGSRQVGLDPRTAVVLTGPGVARLLGRLDGQTRLRTLRARAADDGLGAADVDAVLRALQSSGLLLDGPPTVPAATEPSRVRVVGLGPLGQQVAGLLLAAGLHVVAAGLDRPPPRAAPGRPPAAPPPALDLTAGTAVPPAARGRLTVVNHWSKPEDAAVALTVVAPDTVEPDRTVTEWLVREDQPHLVLRLAGTAATVGPLVLPGRTPCLRCTDLTRRDLDPAWPTLLAQLTTLRLPTPPALLAWAAATAVVQVLARLQHSQPEVVGATLELDAGDHRSRWRAWPLHAECGCAWAPTTEWGP